MRDRRVWGCRHRGHGQTEGGDKPPSLARSWTAFVGVQTGQSWDVIASRQRKGADSPPKLLLLLIFPSEPEPLFA